MAEHSLDLYHSCLGLQLFTRDHNTVFASEHIMEPH